MTKPTKKYSEEHKPLILALDGINGSVEDYFTKAPQKTMWTESVLNQLKGAATQTSDYALDYLDKIDPLSESQLKAIFPNATATQMTDPLSTVTKTRLHDNVRRDPSTQRGLFFLLYFLLGKEMKLVFDVNRKFANEERRTAELDAIQNNDQYLTILEELMTRDDEVDLTVRLSELIFSAEAFGRAVQIKKYDKKMFPCELIPLASTRLGRIWVDRKSWRFLGVEYLDYPKTNRILLAKDIIHHEVNDFHISPNSRYFGMPSIESTMAIAERNRSANEIAIPEMIKRMFAPIMLVKTMTKSETKLQEIRNKWKAGKTLFINDDIEAEVVEIKHDMDGVINAVMEGEKDIYRGLTVPLVVAFQDEQNRATAEHSIIQWYESVLEWKRNRLNDLLWKQWYKPQLELIFDNRDLEKAAMNGQMLQYLETKAMTMEGAKEKENRSRSSGIMTEQYPLTDILPFKVKMEFSNVRTTGFLDTASALVQFMDRRLLNPDMVREEAGLGRYNNDMAEYEQALQYSGNPMVQNFGNDMFTQGKQQFMEQNKNSMGKQQKQQQQQQEDSNKPPYYSNKQGQQLGQNKNKFNSGSKSRLKTKQDVSR